MCTRAHLPFLIAIALIASTFTGCGLLNPASRLYGKWKLDVDATIDRIAGGNDFQKGMIRAAWGVVGGDVIVEFHSDGTGTFTGQSLAGGGVEEGSWSVVRSDAETIAVNITNANSGQTHEVVLSMKGPDTFEYPLNDGKVLIFRRVQQ